MIKDIYISGFADEIDFQLDKQLEVMKDLGISYLSLRSADMKGIADYSLDDIKNKIWPRLQAAGVGVSSIGSPIGKVAIDDDAGFEKQCAQLDTLCQAALLMNCKYIRMFSFYMPEGKNPDDYREQVMAKLQKFVDVAAKYDVILMHENEKDIYGDTGARCLDILKTLGSDHFKAAFDFANFVQCNEDPEECWNMLRPYIVYIHIKDAVTESRENVLCGTGEGKIPQLLKQAIVDEGYTGFLTLEPHLVLFSALKNLETKDTKDIIKEDKYSDGATGYAAQYHALLDILDKF